MVTNLLGGFRRWIPVSLRLALGTAFLSAVADRFGIYGPYGAAGVAWGDFGHFTAYAAKINPWAPVGLVPLLSWAATIAEIGLGLALLLGLYTEVVGLASGVLLLLFALGMTIGTGLKSAVDYSVFSASAGAFALSILGAGPWSLDAMRRTLNARPPSRAP